jgi:glutamine synthetase adenylyltransferase
VELLGDWPADRTRLAPDGHDRLAAILDANPALVSVAREDPEIARAIVAVAQASRAITSFLMGHPLPSLIDPPVPEPEAADPIAVRRFVEGRLVRTAVRDLLGMADMPTVGRELADTADAAATAALAIATATNPGPDIPFSVIAMGKWGAQELNYASDIDVLFVYDTPDGTDPDTARRHANHLATGFISALADVTTEGIAYRVDADLRPEGRNGPLARSLDSYAAYYKRWAHTWEYQSLIKARPAAGNPTLGQAFTTLTTPYVYPDTLPPDAIRDIRTMKARIEHQPRDTTFHLKHGPAGSGMSNSPSRSSNWSTAGSMMRSGRGARSTPLPPSTSTATCAARTQSPSLTPTDGSARRNTGFSSGIFDRHTRSPTTSLRGSASRGRWTTNGSRTSRRTYGHTA